MDVARNKTLQIDPTGPMLLWTAWEGRRRSGLLLNVTACGNRECGCTSVAVVGRAVDEALARVTCGKDGVEFSFTSPPRVEPDVVLDVTVDVHTGAIAPQPDRTREDDPAALALFERALDAALLTELARRHLAAKGWEIAADRWRTTDWTDWSPGTMVQWAEVFGEPRQDSYLHDGRLFLAIEMYCVMPRCTCTDVRVQFVEVVDGEGLWVGTVLVRPPSARVISADCDDAQRALVLQLWEAFTRRHRGAAALQVRRARIRAVGSDILALKSNPLAQSASAATPRPGRNDACHCGSGKKFKRCHGVD